MQAFPKTYNTNMNRIVGFLLVLLWAFPLHAQWYKHLGAPFRNTSAAQARLSVALQKQARIRTAAQVQTAPEQSIFRIQEKNLFLRWGSLEGTAFALEETYQGKKYLWGVTVSHYLFQKPALKLAGCQAIPVSFDIQGNAGMNDISLFLLPPQVAEQITPLQLADQPAQQGDELSSIGYWNGEIHLDVKRIVQEVTQTRFITSLQLDPDFAREGTCGSPVLNREGQVVGVHAGNSRKRQTGIVLPAQHIRQALAAYHQQGNFEQELLFNGISLGALHINESISSIEIMNGSTVLHYIRLGTRAKLVNYAHLEDLLDTAGADRLILWIEKNPLSTHEKDHHYYEWTIEYDLKSGQITRTPAQRLQFP